MSGPLPKEAVDVTYYGFDGTVDLKWKLKNNEHIATLHHKDCNSVILDTNGDNFSASYLKQKGENEVWAKVIFHVFTPSSMYSIEGERLLIKYFHNRNKPFRS